MAYVATKLNTGLLKTVESPFTKDHQAKDRFHSIAFFKKISERRILVRESYWNMRDSFERGSKF